MQANDAPLAWSARWRRHLPEYLMEAGGLALFMVAAAGFATLLEHPASPVRNRIESDLLRRLVMGLAMGGTAIALIYSPIGARTGAHLNPATTIAFFRLGRVHAADAVMYVVAQLSGGIAGIGAATLILAPWIAAPSVHYVSTVPGVWGTVPAFGAEVLIAFLMMTVVLHTSNDARWARYTGWFAGALVAMYITVEAPVSGMSLNPARSFGPALFAGELHIFWIYLFAPLLGMLAAAEGFVRTQGAARVLCAKLNHPAKVGCIFHCRFDLLETRRDAA